jgi:hypothetical protein
VRKALKNHLMSLLKLQQTNDSSFLNVCTLLQDLGVSKEELIRVVPRYFSALFCNPSFIRYNRLVDKMRVETTA